jgi:polysaccharide export outer membrane protein
MKLSHRAFFILGSVAAIFLTACGGGSSTQSTAFTPVPQTQTRDDVQPVRAPASASISQIDYTVASDYTIGADDTLAVDVFQVPDLSRTVQVNSGGFIELPLIGRVTASGLTPQQLSGKIAKELGKSYLKEAAVTVTVKDSGSQKVTVDGAVLQPGIYPITGKTTLVQAIALAKGPDPSLADLHKVTVYRNVNDQRSRAVFDLAAIRDGKQPDPAVYAKDIIVVDISGGRQFLKDFANVFGPVAGIARPY